MTNKQAAKYFSKLPPDEEAIIAAANIDILAATDMPLIIFGDEQAQWADDQPKSHFLGKIGIFATEYTRQCEDLEE